MSGASGPRLLASDDGAVRTLSLSNPSKRNALTRALLDELLRALPREAPGPQQPVRAVILRGDAAGRAFSSGFDITAIDAEERDRGLDPIGEAADAIEACPVPVIAAMDGPAFGGGLEVALACHVRVASTGVRLSMPPAKLGVVYSSSGLMRFLRAVSPSQATRLFLTGEIVSAEEAARIGLVDEVVGEGRAYERARELASAMASNAPIAVVGMLDAIRRLSRPGGPGPDDLMAVEAFRQQALASDDLQEGVRAFVEKRPPRFRGR